MKKKIILSLLVITMLLVGCGSKESSPALKFKEDYESLNGQTTESGKKIRKLKIDKNNRMIQTTAEDIVSRIENKESFVVYFGFPKCPWCRSVIETLISVSNEMEVDIYYVDIKAHDLEVRDTLKLEDGQIVTEQEGTEAYKTLLEKFDSVLADYTLKDDAGNVVETGEKRIYAPNVITVVQGEVLNLATGISPKQTDAYMDLTDEILNDTKKSFEDLLNEYLDEVSMCDVDAQTKC